MPTLNLTRREVLELIDFVLSKELNSTPDDPTLTSEEMLEAYFAHKIERELWATGQEA